MPFDGTSRRLGRGILGPTGSSDGPDGSCADALANHGAGVVIQIGSTTRRKRIAEPDPKPKGATSMIMPFSLQLFPEAVINRRYGIRRSGCES